jgi:hypothetical protein
MKTPPVIAGAPPVETEVPLELDAVEAEVGEAVAEVEDAEKVSQSWVAVAA